LNNFLKQKWRHKMSLANLQNDMVGIEKTEERDSVGGGGAVESGVYDATIEVAYTLKAKSGALGFITVFVTADGSKITDRQYITSGDAKGNKPYYEKDNKKFPLPGYSHVDFMTDLLVGKSLTALQEQEAMLKLYDGALQKEVPTSVTVFPELRGLNVKVGILKIRENKTVKVGSAYTATNEERILNECAKFFDGLTGKTKTELRAGEEAAFITKWKEKNEGQVVDKFKEIAGAAKGGNPFAGQAVSNGGNGAVAAAASGMFGTTPPAAT
jgi:hypothetical protein